MTRRSGQLHAASHVESTASSPFSPAPSDLIRVGSRRWFLQTGAAGIAGLSAAQISQLQSLASESGASGDKKAVILIWLSGGPSQIDMWDPKPDAPQEIRSPYGTIATKVPGVHLTEHLPLQASIADKLSFLRAVDASASDHTPITFQAGNPLAQRTGGSPIPSDDSGYPSMGSVAAKFRGANDPDMPAYVGLANPTLPQIWEAGVMGSQYAPLTAGRAHKHIRAGLDVPVEHVLDPEADLVNMFSPPTGVNIPRLQDRDRLRREFGRLARRLERSSESERLDRHTRQAFEMVLTGKVRQAFDVSRESDQMREAYGKTSIGEKALLARRLVEAGVTFVTLSSFWGVWDHHGDSIVWEGIQKGLTPLMPRVDNTLYVLINDLEQRGMLDDTLVIMMGEFGRSPVINKDAGRDHWPAIMSMVLAGGGLRHGQAIGSSDARGGEIVSGKVGPQDLAATTFRHLGIDLNSHWVNPQGRPVPIITEGGRPIPELA